MKKPNPNRQKKEQPKIQKRWQDDYMNMRSWRMSPVNDDFLEEKGESFVRWCYESRESKKGNKFTIERWLEEEGIPIQTLMTWRKRNPKLEASIQFGKMILGNRLEEGLFTKELSEKAVLLTLHNYLDRYDKDNTYHQNLKNVKDAVSQLLGMTFELPELENEQK